MNSLGRSPVISRLCHSAETAQLSAISQPSRVAPTVRLSGLCVQLAAAGLPRIARKCRFSRARARMRTLTRPASFRSLTDSARHNAPAFGAGSTVSGAQLAANGTGVSAIPRAAARSAHLARLGRPCEAPSGLYAPVAARCFACSYVVSPLPCLRVKKKEQLIAARSQTGMFSCGAGQRPSSGHRQIIATSPLGYRIRSLLSQLIPFPSPISAQPLPSLSLPPFTLPCYISPSTQSLLVFLTGKYNSAQ